MAKYDAIHVWQRDFGGGNSCTTSAILTGLRASEQRWKRVEIASFDRRIRTGLGGIPDTQGVYIEPALHHLADYGVQFSETRLTDVQGRARNSTPSLLVSEQADGQRHAFLVLGWDAEENKWVISDSKYPTVQLLEWDVVTRDVVPGQNRVYAVWACSELEKSCLQNYSL